LPYRAPHLLIFLSNVDATFQRLARRQLSENLGRYAEASIAPRPRDGWISALREALDMTVRQLAARLGVTPSNVTRLEQRERDDTITLGALRRAADALDCDLVYAVVPRQASRPGATDNMLDALISTRARAVATAELRQIAHTMTLEDQTVTVADQTAQIAERTAALIESPKRLWDADTALEIPKGSG
jgi:predicted DNA-binding mobile mystery protein A